MSTERSECSDATSGGSIVQFIVYRLFSIHYTSVVKYSSNQQNFYVITIKGLSQMGGTFS